MSEGLTYEEMARQQDEELRPEIEAIERKVKGSYFQRTIRNSGSAILGTMKGAGNAIADIADTASDLAFYAGLSVDAGLGALFNVGTEEGRAKQRSARLEGVQKLRDGLTSYIRSQETDDKVANFAMNTTESIAKFATFWRAAGGAVGSNIGKALVAGAGEGFTDRPEREMIVMDKLLRGAIESVAPDAVSDFDMMMDMKTDPSVAKQLSKRVMSAVEIGLISAGGEKSLGLAGQGVKAVGKHIPEAMRKKLKDALAQTMDRWRKTKEFLSGADKKSTLNEYILRPGETAFTVKTGVMTPDLSAKDNLRNSVIHEIDSTARILTPEDYSKNLADYEKKLTDLAPQIEAEVVSMAKSRGLSETEQLAKFSRELGIEEAEKMNVEGLKNVLRAQAHNVLLEQEAAKFVMASGNFKRGVINESDYLDSAKSLHVVIQQRMSNLTGAGRTLRAAQEIPPRLQKAWKEIVQSGRTLDEVVAAYGKAIDDPAALKVLADGMDNVMMLHSVVGDSGDEIMASMMKALAKVDTKKSLIDKARDVGNVVGPIYQANLLSATWTLAQNTFGSAAMMFLRATEGAIEAGVGAVIGRQRGGSTIREAMIQYKSMVEGHWDALLLSAKAAKSLAKGQYGEAGNMFRQKMTDIPEMTAKEREFMFRMRKEDMQTLSGKVNDSISRNVYTSFLAGRPVFDFIQLQDITTKSAAARAFMRAKFDTAVYVDDVLGLGKDLVNDKQARSILNDMFRNGRDTFTPDELKLLGIADDKAIEVSQRLAQWRDKTSKEAQEFGVEAAMQTPLTGVLQNAQSILQDTMPFGRVFFPFFTTPVNIVSETLKRMPLIQFGEEGAMGLPVHPDFYRDFNAGGQRRNKAIARLISGMSITQLGMSLAERGIIQHVPHDKQEAGALDTIFNINPGSIIIEGESYPLAALGPIGLLLTYGGALHAHSDMQDKLTQAGDTEVRKLNDALLYNMASFMQIVREAPYAQALDDLASVFELDLEDRKNVDRAKEHFARMAGNLIPYSSFQRQMFQNFDDERRRANGVWENFLQSFAPYMNATAYNALSEKMGNQQGIFARSKTVAADAMMVRLFENGWYPKPLKLDQTIMGRGDDLAVSVRLSNEQWDDFNTIIREELNLRFELDLWTKDPRFIANEAAKRYDLNVKQAESILMSTRRRALDILLDRDITLQMQVEEKRKQAIIDSNKGGYTPAGTIPTFEGAQ